MKHEDDLQLQLIDTIIEEDEDCWDWNWEMEIPSWKSLPLYISSDVKN